MDDGEMGLPLDGSVVKMKGLPFKASIDDVTRFFQGFTLRAQDIYLKRHPDGRPNGEVSLPQDFHIMLVLQPGSSNNCAECP